MAIIIGQNKTELCAPRENEKLTELLNTLKSEGYIISRVIENSGEKYIIELTVEKIETVPAFIQDRIMKGEHNIK